MTIQSVGVNSDTFASYPQCPMPNSIPLPFSFYLSPVGPHYPTITNFVVPGAIYGMPQNFAENVAQGLAFGAISPAGVPFFPTSAAATYFPIQHPLSILSHNAFPAQFTVGQSTNIEVGHDSLSDEVEDRSFVSPPQVNAEGILGDRLRWKSSDRKWLKEKIIKYSPKYHDKDLIVFLTDCMRAEREWMLIGVEKKNLVRRIRKFLKIEMKDIGRKSKPLKSGYTTWSVESRRFLVELYQSGLKIKMIAREIAKRYPSLHKNKFGVPISCATSIGLRKVINSIRYMIYRRLKGMTEENIVKFIESGKKVG